MVIVSERTLFSCEPCNCIRSMKKIPFRIEFMDLRKVLGKNSEMNSSELYLVIILVATFEEPRYSFPQ